MTDRIRQLWFAAARALYIDARTLASVCCDVRRPVILPLHIAPCACGFTPNGTTRETLAQAMIEHSLYHDALTRNRAVIH